VPIGEDPAEAIDMYALTTFHSLASFLMWLKLLYFMRIFKDTGMTLIILNGY
jgi:hypothetical protein